MKTSSENRGLKNPSLLWAQFKSTSNNNADFPQYPARHYILLAHI